MEIIVIGGSLTGLMAGLMLKRQGHKVRILEQFPSATRQNTAAGIGTGPNGKLFIDSHDLDKRPYSIKSEGVHFVNRSGQLTRLLKMPLNLTGWDVLYYRLRANFDGLSSAYCPDPPASLDSDGEGQYDQGKRVTAISYNGDIVTVEFETVDNTSRGTLHANLVIGADGANSTVRRLLAPHSKPEYAGYVAWRGTAPEAEVSEMTRTFFDKGLFSNVLPGDRGYMVGYAMPGKDGTLGRGSRDFNFVWYSKLPASSAAFEAALTDVTGRKHHSTLPRGGMDSKVWAEQLESCKTWMLPAFREVAEKVIEPFISTINDCSAPKARYYDDKVLLLGEALLLIRPHVGLSFDITAFQVLQLKKAISGEIALDEWETRVSSNNRKAELFSMAYGRYFLYGILRPSFLLGLVKYILFLARGFLRRILFRQ